MATKKKKQAPVKISVPLPPDVHMAVALAGVTTGKSNSTLIADLVQQRFGNGNRAALKALKPGDGEAWKRVSVFLSPHLKDKATHEVQRQHGASEDKRATGSLAAAIAALVAQAYVPGYKL